MEDNEKNKITILADKDRWKEAVKRMTDLEKVNDPAICVRAFALGLGFMLRHGENYCTIDTSRVDNEELFDNLVGAIICSKSHEISKMEPQEKEAMFNLKKTQGHE